MSKVAARRVGDRREPINPAAVPATRSNMSNRVTAQNSPVRALRVKLAAQTQVVRDRISQDNVSLLQCCTSLRAGRCPALFCCAAAPSDLCNSPTDQHHAQRDCDQAAGTSHVLTSRS
jgi:hypothetical protein